MTITRHDVPVSDGPRIPVWTSGAGRPLLIVHGGMVDHEAWEPVREHLDGSLRVAIMDRRTSFENPLTPHDIETEFSDVAPVMEFLGDEVDLLGHSTGGLIALGAALQASNLRRLVLYEGGLMSPEFRAEL